VVVAALVDQLLVMTDDDLAKDIRDSVL